MWDPVCPAGLRAIYRVSPVVTVTEAATVRVEKGLCGTMSITPGFQFPATMSHLCAIYHWLTGPQVLPSLHQGRQVDNTEMQTGLKSGKFGLSRSLGFGFRFPEDHNQRPGKRTVHLTHHRGAHQIPAVLE